jgi:hypothetical protein
MGSPDVREVGWLRRKSISGFAATVIGIGGMGAGVGIGYSVSKLTQPEVVSSYKPGGEWLNPLEPISHHSGRLFSFRMQAYPTKPNITPIERVYVTYSPANKADQPWRLLAKQNQYLMVIILMNGAVLRHSLQERI